MISTLVYLFVTRFIQVLTPEQLDVLLKHTAGILTAIASVIGPILIGLVLNRQKKNKGDLDAKLQENTAVTKAVHAQLTESELLRNMTTTAERTGEGDPFPYSIQLPGPKYEIFPYTSGADTYWKSEPTETGKLTRFLATGDSVLGFHFHLVDERFQVVRGRVIIETADSMVDLKAGDTFEAVAKAPHKITFRAAEVLMHWPELATDTLATLLFK